MTHYDLTKESGFKQFYLFYYPKLVRFSQEYVLLLDDAEDIVQDVFVIIWKERHSLGHVQNMNAYLFRLVKNKCIDFLRHKTMCEEKHKILQDNLMREYESNLLSMENFNENDIEEEDREAQAWAALQSLSEGCREVFILSKLEGMSHQAIADKLNISLSTVNNQVCTAVSKLKNKLKGYSFFLLFLL
ncbi:MAG: RNA polymerase sigma-70 factor [Tannerella sp.]|jgi:RNA polymerase sigma-70 factor (ECF subfamily)|nr:RNA polymerase sigma-70 factor [Tannerella sp.]